MGYLRRYFFVQPATPELNAFTDDKVGASLTHSTMRSGHRLASIISSSSPLTAIGKN